MIGVVDVFAGCGGLSEGFSRLNKHGAFPFDVRLHIEKEKAPVQTLRLRTFYHQFSRMRVTGKLLRLCPWKDGTRGLIPRSSHRGI